MKQLLQLTMSSHGVIVDWLPRNKWTMLHKWKWNKGTVSISKFVLRVW